MYAGEVNSSLLGKSEDMTFRYKKVDLPGYMLEPNEDKYPRENGQWQSSKIGMETKLDKRTERHLDVVDFHPGKNRSGIDNFFTYHLYFEFSFKFCEFSYIDGQ